MKHWVIDQMNRRVEVPVQPLRIVSLVPSQTELLYALGLSEEVVGQTLFCIHPEQMHKHKPRVGGTKNVNIDKVRALNPDLIIANKEENDEQTIRKLSELFPVWISDIVGLDSAIDMILKVGALVGKGAAATELTRKIQAGFQSVSVHQSKTCVYLIWRKPWMAAGHDTFIHEMLERLGLHNLAQSFHSRYPELTPEWLFEVQPQVLLLSSEPYPFKEKHLEELRQLCPDARILLVDGELFSWYGSRLQYSPAYFQDLQLRINQ